MSKLNLRQAREKAGVSVEFVAEQMGVSVELVKSWEAFLHQFRHHLQNEARELSRKYLLMEDDPKADYRIPYREANSMLYGEDDAVAWSRFLIENC